MKLFITVILLVPFVSLAQNVEKLEKKAENYFYTEELDKALGLYMEILRVDSRNNLAKYRIEICSLLTKYRNKPIDKIISYANTQGKKDKFYNYWMGKIHFSQNHFKKAIKSFNAFLAQKKYKSKDIIDETKELISWAELLELKFTHPENYEIEQLTSTVNSKYIEYSPVYFKAKEELLFLSSNPKGGGNAKEGRFHVYQSLREGEGWSKPELISKFGHFQATNANIEVVANDGRLFLYKDQGKGGLYYSELNDKIWADLKAFDSQLTGKKMDSHFFINEREDRILFAAPAKRGVKDNLEIFESKKDPSTGEWSSPSIFSKSINSTLNEDYPYLTADEQTLYFSSKGHGSMGGYDVFKSEYDERGNTWSAPISLNYPTNTQNDDIQFKIDQESNSGYFVSDRLESMGGFDIFFFHEFDKILYEGIVTDAGGKAVDHAILVFTPTRGTNLEAKISTDQSGFYKVKLGINDQYKVAISFHDEIVHQEVFDTKPSSNVGSISKNFNIAENKKAREVVAYEHKSPKYVKLEKIGNKFRHSNKVILSNIYFALNDYKISNITKENLQELAKKLKEHPNLKLEISGHTDNLGAANLNMNISKLRAKSVKDYLISTGINSQRLIAKGYGETRPLASNDDEKDGRELNRRIEVMVIE